MSVNITYSIINNVVCIFKNTTLMFECHFPNVAIKGQRSDMNSSFYVCYTLLNDSLVSVSLCITEEVSGEASEMKLMLK